MKLKLLVSLLLVWCLIEGFCQKTNKSEFPLLPFVNGISSIGDGQLEIGVKKSFEGDITKYGTKISDVDMGNLKLGVRFPTLKDDKNVVQLDRKILQESSRFFLVRLIFVCIPLYFGAN